MRVLYIVGTRPEFIRSVSLIKTLCNDRTIDSKLVHTGQHYDYPLDKIFFDELKIIKPDINIHCTKNSSAITQITEIMNSMEKIIKDFEPQMIAVFGDTNSSLAGALSAVKMNIPLAHLEAGCREYELDVPEETNRRIIDHCANLLYPVSELDVDHLKGEKVMGMIKNFGDPLFEVYTDCITRSHKLKYYQSLGLQKYQYSFITLHRNINVDNHQNLVNILSGINSYTKLPVIFPAHPRTLNELKKIKNTGFMKNIRLISPLSYLKTLNLMSNAKFVITDSGGLQKEAFWSQIPCITIRNHTAWQDTVKLGVNFLVKPEIVQILHIINYVTKNYTSIKKRFKKIENPYYKINTASYIVEDIKEFIRNKN